MAAFCGWGPAASTQPGRQADRQPGIAKHPFMLLVFWRESGTLVMQGCIWVGGRSQAPAWGVHPGDLVMVLALDGVGPYLQTAMAPCKVPR